MEIPSKMAICWWWWKILPILLITRKGSKVTSAHRAVPLSGLKIKIENCYNDNCHTNMHYIRVWLLSSTYKVLFVGCWVLFNQWGFFAFQLSSICSVVWAKFLSAVIFSFSISRMTSKFNFRTKIYHFFHAYILQAISKSRVCCEWELLQKP